MNFPLINVRSATSEDAQRGIRAASGDGEAGSGRAIIAFRHPADTLQLKCRYLQTVTVFRNLVSCLLRWHLEASGASLPAVPEGKNSQIGQNEVYLKTDNTA